MSNRIDECQRELHSKQKLGFIGLLPIIPEYSDENVAFADMLVESGIDILMIHIPNWIPWMEGPVLQHAAKNPRVKGLKREDVFELTKKIREKHPKLPLILMTLYDTVLTMGQEQFLELANEADVDGFDIPNYPKNYFDDSLGFYKKCIENNQHLILAISYEVAMSLENTKEYELLKQMTKDGRGFVFIMNAPGGKSGSNNTLTEAQLSEAVKRVQELLDKEENGCRISVVCGISKPEDVVKISRSGADTFMIGSAYIKKMLEGQSMEQVSEYIQLINSATKTNRI